MRRPVRAASERAEIVRHVAKLPDQLGVAAPVAGSPVRLNATAPTWPSLRESASARITTAIHRARQPPRRGKAARDSSQAFLRLRAGVTCSHCRESEAR